jgi:hypothetical protein
MQSQFVIVNCDIYCKWTGPYPVYRVYVNNELFTERTWIWQDVYLEEALQIQAPVGKYTIQVELVNTEHAAVSVRNLRIGHGPAIITRDGLVQIYTPEATSESI